MLKPTLRSAVFSLGVLLSVPRHLPAVLSGTAYTEFAAACSAAVAAGNADKTMSITKSWQNIPSQTCAASLVFESGKLLQPASSAELILTGYVTARTFRLEISSPRRTNPTRS
jgi:hypothetical protein